MKKLIVAMLVLVGLAMVTVVHAEPNDDGGETVLPL